MGNKVGGNLTIIGKNGQTLDGYSGRNLKVSVNGANNSNAQSVNVNGGNKYKLNAGDKFNIFNEISKLDGKQGLSEADVNYARAKLDRSKLGISDIRQDSDAGIVRIICKDGSQIVFDFESDKEIKDKKIKDTEVASAKFKATAKLLKAKQNGYAKFYDINISADGKFYLIKVKETSLLYPDPQIYHIKKDFGLKENVFLNNNPDLIGAHPDNTDTRNYDQNKIKGGTTIKLPVSDVSFDNGPSKFFGRLVSVG